MHKCSIASMLNGEFASDGAAKNRIFLRHNHPSRRNARSICAIAASCLSFCRFARLSASALPQSLRRDAPGAVAASGPRSGPHPQTSRVSHWRLPLPETQNAWCAMGCFGHEQYCDRREGRQCDSSRNAGGLTAIQESGKRQFVWRRC
jgi:hypothetical protein